MKKILFADDNKNIREMAAMILEKFGYEVILAEDGWAVDDIVKNKKIDLAILDVMMPMIDGFVLCDTLKKDPETKNIPVILLTALNQDCYVNKGEQVGADLYITKPVDWNLLKEKIAELILKNC